MYKLNSKVKIYFKKIILINKNNHKNLKLKLILYKNK